MCVLRLLGPRGGRMSLSQLVRLRRSLMTSDPGFGKEKVTDGGEKGEKT